MFDVSCQCLKKTVNQNKSLYITVYIIRIEYLFLMHKKEINKIKNNLELNGFTVIPLKLYFKGSLAKLLIGVAKGKHNYDKRETIKKRDQERELKKYIKKNI